MGERDDGVWRQLPGWESAHEGLRWYFRALVAYCVLLGVSILLGVFVAMAASKGALMMTLVVTGSLGLAVQAMALFGLSKYAAVPSETGAQGPAKAALVIAAVVFVLGLLLFIKQLASAAGSSLEGFAGTDGWSLLSGLANLVMMVLFLQSLSRVSAFIGRADLHKLASTTLILLGVLIALGVLAGAIAGASATGDPSAVGFTMLLLLLIAGLGIWMLVNVMMLVHQLSKAIERDVDLTRAFD